MKKLVLASKSPRRVELLKMMGFDFAIIPSHINEDEYLGLNPVEMVKKLAKAKAERVAENLENTVVIAADTIVLIDDIILGKPLNRGEAVSILQKIQGEKHQVFTGFAVCDTETKNFIVDYDKTDVFMRSISDEEIMSYVDTGEPMDKAGAYGIQGIGGIFVDKILGSYFTVMGLPIHKLALVLRDFDFKIF
ncbi:Maf family protein [Natronospora cellulosivora (SeqCode)]